MVKRSARLSGILGSAGSRSVLVGFAPASTLFRASRADVLDESTGRGYQRRISEQHSLDFRRYIQRAGSTTIPLTFNVRPGQRGSWRLVRRPGRGAELLLDLSRGPVLLQVDCQHRLGYLEGLSVELPFMIYTGLTEREEMEVFNVINSKARGLSGSLLDFHDSRLSADLGHERPELLVALRLNEDSSSPWFKSLDLGGVSTSGMKRRASLRTMQKAVRRFLTASNVLAETDVDHVAAAVLEYWEAVRTVLATEWEQPRRHMITKGIGVYSLMGLLSDLWQEIRSSGLAPNRATFAALLSDFVHEFDWSSQGPLRGLGGESGAREALAILRFTRARALSARGAGAHA